MHILKLLITRILNHFGLKVTRINRKKNCKTMDVFLDSEGNRFNRLKGYRKQVWPTCWEEMNNRRLTPTVRMVKKSRDTFEARKKVNELERFLNVHDMTIISKQVLEIGCFSGACAYAMAEFGAAHVDAIDVSANFVDPNKKCDPESLQEASRWLDRYRSVTAGAFGATSHLENVAFYDIDVRNIEKESVYDLVVSWQTLEHILIPEKALSTLYNVLRPGGISYHVYHPFFCLSGAHFDTLDFPWGHVRLSPADFERYVKLYRPLELRTSSWRFNETLNRMTLAELKKYIYSAGFEFIAMCEFSDDGIMESVDKTIFNQAKTLYPFLQINDLITSSVTVLFKKPERNKAIHV